MTTPMPATFAELETRETVAPEDLMASLRDYADKGAAISASVVTTILARTPLDLDQMAHLAESAELGYAGQKSRGFVGDARSYRHVAEFLRELAAAPAMKP